MEVGNHDLSKYITGAFDKISFDDLTNLFFDFMNFYKISEGIIKSERKIFIHSDIKPDNIILYNNKGKFELKLIDFGVSIFSDTFNDSNNYGTEYMYKMLFTYDVDNRYKEQIAFRSPLFDIFSVIVSYLQVILLNSVNINITDGKQKFNDILIITNDKIKSLTTNDATMNKYKRMIAIAEIIYKFHQENIKNYVDSYGNVGLIFSEKLKRYKETINLKNLDISKFRRYSDLPKYIVDSKKLELENDYLYLDRIMKYYLYKI